MKRTLTALATLLAAPISVLASPSPDPAAPATSPNVAHSARMGVWSWCSPQFSCQSDEECRMQFDCYAMAEDHLDQNIVCKDYWVWKQCLAYEKVR
ncbi:hypothetical protein EMCG_04808 [[Emmonsia] crescens]|uniref:Extracellular membrane protein CFEM domain-containing protein n=1 Tax=[Emmonsia] crescens TaxID=73230 RepID=A0A0G2IYF3_9EURO|nr:hypothetical protein EMCG_04808 [Emmonsia crescens UAMH 3008]